MSHDEFWAPIPGYEGIYSVSTLGNFVRHVGLGIKPVAVTFSPSNGYGYVHLSKDGVAQNYRAHRLVLWAHVGLPPDASDGRHLDGDKSNNTLANLAWGSHADNIADNVRNGTHRGAAAGQDHHNAKLSDDAVEAIFNQWAQGMSQKNIAAFWSVSPSNISKILSGKSRQSENANKRAEMRL